MENGKEQQYINRLPYLPISSRIVIEALKGKSAEQLSEIGITGGLLFMIRQGYAKKLREDVFNKVSWLQIAYFEGERKQVIVEVLSRGN